MLSAAVEDPQDLKRKEPVFIEFDGIPVPFYFESVESKGGRFIVKLQDVDTLAEAEELVGREVFFEEEDDGEDDSPVGLKVRDSRSRRIVGEIVDFTDYSGNMVITVQKEDGEEVLLPLHEDLVVSIHDEVMTLDIPFGLL